MAVVEAEVRLNHRGRVNELPSRQPQAASRGQAENDWQAICECGWRSPRYSGNDRGTADIGLAAHVATAKDGDPIYVLTVVASTETAAWEYAWHG